MADDSDCVMEVCQDNDCEIVAEIPPVQIIDNKQLAEGKKEEGNQLYKLKRYKEAVDFYTQAIRICPDVAAYYSNRAACHMMNGNYRVALRDAKQSIELDSTFVKGYVREVRCCVILGDTVTAIRSLEKLRELDPTNPACITEKANIVALRSYEADSLEALRKQDFRKIVYLMDRALQISPASHKFRLQKAECLAYLKRFQEAQDIANDILQIDESNIDAIHVRGTCLYYQDKTEKAFSHFQHVLRLAPDHSKAKDIYRKAKLLMKKKDAGNQAFRQGQYQEAYNLYTEALKVDPYNVYTNSKLYCNRATVLSKLQKSEQAVDDCNYAIELDNKYMKAFSRRAKCYMDLEKYEEAVRDYEHIYKLDKTRLNKHLLQEAKTELKKSKRKDYYKLLGIGKNATDDDIKKAYRKRAMVHHPDRHSNASEEDRKEQERKFKEIGEAYSILSDPKKKSRYDNGYDLEDLDNGFSDIDPNNIFHTFFGSSGGNSFHYTGDSTRGCNSQQFNGFPGGFAFQFQ